MNRVDFVTYHQDRTSVTGVYLFGFVMHMQGHHYEICPKAGDICVDACTVRIYSVMNESAITASQKPRSRYTVGTCTIKIFIHVYIGMYM
jgi:hypothetical protein